MDDGLIIISGHRNADFVLKYWSSSLSKHSLVNVDSNDYDKIPKKLKNIFENNLVLFIFEELNLKLVYENNSKFKPKIDFAS